MNKILIAEDDESIATLMCTFLTKNGYFCERVADGAAAAKRVETTSFDLVLLDIMLPEIDGFTLLPYLLEYHLPVIFITAKADVADRVRGLRMGAEDYIVKPFDLSELQARVETVLRRYHKTERFLNIGSVCIDTDSRTVARNGMPVELTPKEYDLLLLFARNHGIAMYRETLYERVWNEPYFGNTRTVDLHVQRLRKKLGLWNEIQSVHKIGYRLSLPEDNTP